MKIVSYILALLLFICQGVAGEYSSAFVVKLFGKKVKVLAPMRYKKDTSVIIENKTLQTQIGKLVTSRGKLIDYVTVESQKSKSYVISMSGSDEAIFIPMAPAFQEVRLIAGKKSYESPPRQESR